jgi:VCBS repeat-containing protein
MRRVRLVIADRRPIVLQGFASMFVAQRDFEIVASCTDGASCLEAIRTLSPDVALLEDAFPDVTASEILAVANAENLPTRLIFFTASVARGDLAAAIEAGTCSAISMRERPETLLQSLRLVAGGAGFPHQLRPDRAPAGKEGNGKLGENVLAVLTGREREIMRWVVEGLPNKAIARQLNVSEGTIKVHLHNIFQKLEIKNRTELAALALSLPRYGGFGALAALIFAAIDDVQATDSTVSAGHAVIDTFTVMAADGTAELVTIIINRPKDPTAASGAAAKAVIKARGVLSAAPGTSIPTGKLVDSGVDNTASTVTLPSLSSPRPNSGVPGAFMMAAAGMWIYTLGNSNGSAQGFDLSGSLTDEFTVATANGIKQLATVTIPSRADAAPDGFDNLALVNREISDLPFAFGIPRGDTIAIGGDELQIANGGDARAGETIDHGGFATATATDAPEHVEHGATPASAGGDSNREQSQRDLHAASEDGSAAAEQHDASRGNGAGPEQSQRHLRVTSDEDSAAAKHHAEHDAPGGNSSRGQSQRDLHAASEDGSTAADQHEASRGNGAGPEQSQRHLRVASEDTAVAKQHAAHDAPGGGSDHGQSQRDLHAASEEGSAAAEQHTEHDTTPGSGANSDQAQRGLHTGPVKTSNYPHSESNLNAGGKGQAATDNANQAEPAAAPGLGDSFYFKNEMADFKNSDTFEQADMGHGPDSTARGPHAARHDGLPPIHDADPIGPSLAEQNAADHARGAERHATHDLIV